MLGHLILTPARSRTIWLIWVALVIAIAVSHLSELSVREARGEFANDDDEVRKLAILFLAGLVIVGIPVSAAVTWMCLRRHRFAVNLLAFDEKRLMISAISSLAAGYLVYLVTKGLLKVDREMWFAVPVELTEIWYVLVLRAALVAPRDPL